MTNARQVVNTMRQSQESCLQDPSVGLVMNRSSVHLRLLALFSIGSATADHVGREPCATSSEDAAHLPMDTQALTSTVEYLEHGGRIAGLDHGTLPFKTDAAWYHGQPPVSVGSGFEGADPTLGRRMTPQTAHAVDMRCERDRVVDYAD